MGTIDKRNQRNFILIALCILLILIIMFLIINKIVNKNNSSSNNGELNGNTNEILKPISNYSGDIKGFDNSSILSGKNKIELIQKVKLNDPISISGNKVPAILVADDINFVDVNTKSYADSTLDYDKMIDTEIKITNNVIDVALIPSQWEIETTSDFIQYRLSEFGNINTVLFNHTRYEESRVFLYVVTDKKELYRCLMYPEGEKVIQITKLNVDNIISVAMIDALDPDNIEEYNPSVIIKTEDNKYYTDYPTEDGKDVISELDI